MDTGHCEGTKLLKAGTGHSPIPSATAREQQGGHEPLSPVLKRRGLGHVTGAALLCPSQLWPVVSIAQGPEQGWHLQVCREKWRLSVAGVAAAKAEGSAWPSRYWMERSWKQGSASSTAVARSALRRDTVRLLP